LLKEQVIVRYEMDNSEKLAVNSNEPLGVLVRGYGEGMVAALKKEELDEKSRADWNHLNHLIDVVKIETLMTKDFDFKHYYCEYGKYEMKELAEFTKKNLSKL
jgi:hypothetical protein